MARRLNVLLVEDSLLDAELVERELRGYGFDLQLARVDSEAELRATLLQGGCDVVLCDYRLPALSMMQALAVCQELGLDCPFIVLSGTIGEEAAVEALRAGARSVVLKSNLGRLGPVIEQELADAEVRRAQLAAAKALRESEERLQLALAAGHMLVSERSVATGEVVWRGERAGWLMARSDDEMRMPLHELRDLVHPADRPRFDEAVRARELSVAGELEYRVRDAEGGYRWILTQTTPVVGSSGAVERVVGVWVDTTARKEAELHLEQHARQQAAVVALGQSALAGVPVQQLFERAAVLLAETLDVEYATVAELLPDGAFLLLRAGVGWREGVAGREILPAGEGSQAGYTLLAKEPVVARDLATETRFEIPPLLTEHGIQSGLSVVIRGRDEAFGVLAAYSTASRKFDPNDVTFLEGVSVVLSDAIERAARDDELQESLERLREADTGRRDLLERLVRAQEDERLRIASDIHDDSVQVLTALALRLDLLHGHAEDAELREALEVIAQTVRTAIERLRRLIFDLRPPALDRGLAAALREYLEQARAEHGLDSRLHQQLEVEPDPQSRAILYRIAREALANVVKHAAATVVDVELTTVAGGSRIRIADDGAGFDVDQVGAGRAGRLGLLAMRERAEMVGGSFQLVSSPGEGTTVEFFVPMEPEAGTRG